MEVFIYILYGGIGKILIDYINMQLGILNQEKFTDFLK